MTAWYVFSPNSLRAASNESLMVVSCPDNSIGSEMSNCVGWGYKEAILQRRATIVYALFKNQYKICIEVTPEFTIRQAFGPHNSQLRGEALEAYSEWCTENKIKRKNVFSCRLAPNAF